MEKKTLEKDMTLMQQIGMVTFNNVIRALIDNAIDFQIFTRECDGYIVKEIGRLPIYFTNGYCTIDIISFKLFEQKGSLIYLYYDDEDDLIEEYNTFKGFDIILNMITDAVKNREAV